MTNKHQRHLERIFVNTDIALSRSYLLYIYVGNLDRKVVQIHSNSFQMF